MYAIVMFGEDWGSHYYLDEDGQVIKFETANEASEFGIIHLGEDDTNWRVVNLERKEVMVNDMDENLKNFKPPIQFDRWIWDGKCWKCGKDIVEQSIEKKIHYIHCSDHYSVFNTIESLLWEANSGDRAFE